LIAEEDRLFQKKNKIDCFRRRIAALTAAIDMIYIFLFVADYSYEHGG